MDASGTQPGLVKRRTALLACALAFASGVLAKGALVRAAEEAPAAAVDRSFDPFAVYRVPVEGSPSMGPEDALVTIVEFIDYQCPFCLRALETVRQIREVYGDDVRVVVKNYPLPLHEQATAAAEASIAAHLQGRFEEMHELLLENQKTLEREALERLASGLGLDLETFRASLRERSYRWLVEADKELAETLGATATPSFFVNGRYLRGAQPFSAFRALIDEELLKAHERIATGTPTTELYSEIIAGGLTTLSSSEAACGE